MTVPVEIPFIRYTGNDVTRSFPFNWSSVEAIDIYVEIDGNLALEGVGYELEDYKTGSDDSDDGGGNIVFTVPPVTGTDILIFRETPITQQVDYVPTQPFPADTHEAQMDKDTYILQEITGAGRGGSGPVDLAAVPQPSSVEITNTAGTNASIPPWSTDELLAGVFHGEVVALGGAPVDGSVTTKPNGYIWWELTN